MGRSRHLQVYQSAYAFSLEMYKLKIKLPASLKHDLGTMIYASSLRILKGIVIANSSNDKIKPLQGVLLETEILWPFLKMAEDLRGISVNQFKLYTDLLVEITTQIQAWLKWSKSEKTKSK